MNDREFAGKSLRLRARNVLRYNRDFWATENRAFAKPHFRSRKVARIVRNLAGRKECNLLDVGCGVGTFARLLPENVHYYGIDIAIHDAAPNLIEMDLLENPVEFRGMKFDLVLAQGLFEYLGDRQAQKFVEIRAILKDGGKFIVTYTNFAHRRRNLYHAYSNVKQPGEFRRDLSRIFTIERAFPGAHNWKHTLPTRRLVEKAQSRLDVNIPILSPILAVDYFYICSPRPQEGE